MLYVGKRGKYRFWFTARLSVSQSVSYFTVPGPAGSRPPPARSPAEQHASRAGGAVVVIRVAHTSPNAKTGPNVIKAACGRLLLDAYPHTSRHDTKMGQPIMP